MKASDGMPRRRGYSALAVVAMFFPWTLAGWIAFFAVMASLVLPIFGILLFNAPLLIPVIIWAAITRRRMLLRSAALALAWTLILNASSLAIGLATGFLALLVSNGSIGGINYSDNWVHI